MHSTKNHLRDTTLRQPAGEDAKKVAEALDRAIRARNTQQVSFFARSLARLFLPENGANGC